MTPIFQVKRLSSGYWYARFAGPGERFAQWADGLPTLADCFGWWSAADLRALQRQIGGTHDPG